MMKRRTKPAGDGKRQGSYLAKESPRRCKLESQR